MFSNQLINFIQEWAKSKDIFVKLFSYINAEEFWENWGENEDYDIIFLDIKMDRINGMELARLIRKTNKNIPIVFTTNMKEYVIQGYTVSAMHYLIKPVKKETCFQCLNKVLKNRKERKYYIINDIDVEKIVKIPTTEIIYITMHSHTATMITTKKEYEFRKTISQILTELDDKLFVKCHKSYIINIRHVESISKNFVYMSNDKEIPIGRNIAKEINDLFLKYNINKT